MPRTVYISKESHENPVKGYRQTMFFVARDAKTNEMVFLPPSNRKAEVKDLIESYGYELISKPTAV